MPTTDTIPGTDDDVADDVDQRLTTPLRPDTPSFIAGVTKR